MGLKFKMMANSLSLRHYLKFDDFTQEEYAYLFRRAAALKKMLRDGELYQPFLGKVMSMIFEKNSTRTRVSFEAGMSQFGGHAIFLDGHSSQIGRGEPVADTARVLSRMSDILMIRTFEQATIDELAAFSRVPVINGLSNQHHPCQVLADIFTWVERRGSIEGRTVAWVGDGNNMARSWAQAARVLNFNLRVATPKGYELILDACDEDARIVCTYDPVEAVRGADIVTTDVFTSMGFEDETAIRLAAFAGFEVTQVLMNHAHPDALFMHCLPAHRGEEVSAEVIDGAQSVVWDEAENRLHAQKAVIEFLLLGKSE